MWWRREEEATNGDVMDTLEGTRAPDRRRQQQQP